MDILSEVLTDLFSYYVTGCLVELMYVLFCLSWEC